jgi:hypothetical protein
MMGLFTYAVHQEIKQLQSGAALRAFLLNQGYFPPHGVDPLEVSDTLLSDEALDEALEDICIQVEERAQSLYW